jgi:type III restriction enzyme
LLLRIEDLDRDRSRLEFREAIFEGYLGTHGRWAFAEFTDIYEIQSAFAAKVESEFNKMIETVLEQVPEQKA